MDDAPQLVQTILDQSHLIPLTTQIQPTLCDFDHTLRLYPLPTAVRLQRFYADNTGLICIVHKVVLADKYEKYKLTYSGCHVFNPGSFLAKSFAFSTYSPAETSSEEGAIDMDAED